MSHMITNEKLMAKLQHIQDFSLIAMEAPAGYGKTTAIQELLSPSFGQIFWYTAVESIPDTSFRWFIRQLASIDEKSAEKLSALGFLNRSNADEAADILAKLHSPAALPRQDWENGDSKPSFSLTLVFDNFQFSLNNWEPQIFSVLAHSTDSGIRTIFLSQNFGRFRNILHELENNICFIRGTDLLLEESDIQKYARQKQLVLSSGDLHKIYQKTDGWAAAVALYLNNLSEDGDTDFVYQDISGILEKRFWHKLSGVQQIFFLSICLFDRFAEQDADFLIPPDMLDHHDWRLLLNNSPLIRSFAYGKVWFLHEILLTFLRRKLKETSPEFQKEIYIRSAGVYAGNGMIREAAELYLRAKDYEGLLSLRLQGLISEKFDNLSYAELARTVLTEAPESVLQKYPLSLLRLCYGLYAGCMFEEYKTQMKRVRKIIEAMDDPHLLGEWYLVAAFIHFPDVKKMEQKYSRAEELMEHSSEIFVKEEPFLFGCTSMWYLFYSKSGEMLKTAEWFASCMKRYNRLTNGHGSGAAELYLGEAYSVQGRFEESDIQAYQAAFLSEQAGNATVTYGASLLLGINAIYRSDMTGLKKAIDYLENKAQGYTFLKGKLLNTYMLETVRGYLLGLMMETSRSAMWTQGEADSLSDLTFTNFMIKTCRITDLLLKKEYKMAIASVETSLILDKRLISVPTRNFMYCGLALCYMAIGRLLKAAEYLDQSLTLAGQDKNYTFLACFRKYFQPLFLMPHIASKHKETIREIKALDIRYTRADESHIFAMLEEIPELKEAAELNELTKREQDVAQLVAKGYRNHEIAEELHISENTVKHHLKIIFQKMNIDRRTKLIEMLS